MVLSRTISRVLSDSRSGIIDLGLWLVSTSPLPCYFEALHFKATQTRGAAEGSLGSGKSEPKQNDSGPNAHAEPHDNALKAPSLTSEAQQCRSGLKSEAED